MPLPSPHPPHSPPPPPPASAADPVAAIARELRRLLAGIKQALEDEIRAYPTPIPRCDAQFNHLYEQRARLSRLLQRVDAALAHGAGTRALVGALAEYAAAPAFSERSDEARLRERIGTALAKW
jgi:hypothetical protein